MYGCGARSIWLCLILHLDLGHPLDFLHIDTSSASLDLAAFLHTPFAYSIIFHHQEQWFDRPQEQSVIVNLGKAKLFGYLFPTVTFQVLQPLCHNINPCQGQTRRQPASAQHFQLTDMRVQSRCVSLHQNTKM